MRSGPQIYTAWPQPPVLSILKTILLSRLQQEPAEVAPPRFQAKAKKKEKRLQRRETEQTEAKGQPATSRCQMSDRYGTKVRNFPHS
ncbi:hypothetical protein Q8A73_000233 [Channa argus]|nr:hypothetical protein Q8A73_000233 [Channa argus]